MLRPVVYDVGKDQPARHSEVRACSQRFGQSHVIEGLHVVPQAVVLLETERMDWGEVVEHKPLIPHIRFPNLVFDAEFPPASVDVADVAKRLEGASGIQPSGTAGILI